MSAWDTQKAISNFSKHGVSFEYAATVFSDFDGLDIPDLKHSARENRSKRIGMSSERRILVIIYTLRTNQHGKEIIRIISCRQANLKERQAYAG